MGGREARCEQDTSILTTMFSLSLSKSRHRSGQDAGDQTTGMLLLILQSPLEAPAVMKDPL